MLNISRSILTNFVRIPLRNNFVEIKTKQQNTVVHCQVILFIVKLLLLITIFTCMQ